MIRKSPHPLVLLAALLGGCAGPQVAAQTESTIQPRPAALTPAEQVAGALAAAAEAAGSGNRPALARAVGVLERSGARPLPPADGDGVTAATSADPAPDPVLAWRDSVRDLAGPPFRGSPLGPGYRSGRLGGGGRDSFNQLFLSGTGATIALSAPTGDRVGLRVLDRQARPVCDGDTARGQPCRWVPLFTERYTIVVTNLGPGDARYFLVIQ